MDIHVGDRVLVITVTNPIIDVGRVVELWAPDMVVINVEQEIDRGVWMMPRPYREVVRRDVVLVLKP